MTESIRRGDIPGVQLRCRREVLGTADEVWRYLVEPERLVEWLAAEALPLAPPASGYELRGGQLAGESVAERFETVEAERPRRLRAAFEHLGQGWPVATRLEIELTPLGVGTEVSVLQESFQALPLSRCLTIWEAYRVRWRVALERLDGALRAAAERP